MSPTRTTDNAPEFVSALTALRKGISYRGARTVGRRTQGIIEALQGTANNLVYYCGGSFTLA